MIQIGCKKHPRYQAKSQRPPKGCLCCLDLWWLRRATLARSELDTVLYTEELKTV